MKVDAEGNELLNSDLKELDHVAFEKSFDKINAGITDSAKQLKISGSVLKEKRDDTPTVLNRKNTDMRPGGSRAGWYDQNE